MRDASQGADVICYSVGSFYTSLIATLLPTGAGDAVAHTDPPKVYVPNTGADDEESGMGLADRVRALLHFLRGSAADGPAVGRLLSHIMIDASSGTPPEDVTALVSAFEGDDD